MAAVPSPDVTLTRGPARISPVRVFIPQLVSIATAKVNAPTAITYPTGDIPIDNLSADFVSLARLGRFVRITDPSTGAIKYEGTLRQAADATTLKIDGINTADTGIALFTANTIADNDDVTVYRPFRPAAQWSRIDPSTSELLKMWDNAYTDQTEEPRPQINVEPHHHQAAAVDSTSGVATFTLDASNSFSWNGNSLTFAWELPTGVTLAAGYNLTDATIEVEADPGEYIVQCTGTDSVTTKDKRADVWLFAYDDDTYSAFYNQYNVVEINNDESTRRGWSCQLVIEADAAGLPTRDNYLYTGAIVLMQYTWEYSTDGGATYSALSADSTRTFVGYLRDFTDITPSVDGRDRIALNIEGPMIYFNSFGIAVQALIEDAAPDNWAEVSTSLNNCAFFAYYLLNDHTRTPLRQTNFWNDDGFSSFRRESFSTDKGTIADAMNSVSAYIPGANVGSTANGDIYLRRHLSFEGSSYRSGKANRFTFTTADLFASDENGPILSYNFNQLKRAAEVDGAFLVYASSGLSAPYRARSGYLAPAPGVSLETVRSFIALSQADGQERVGNYAAWFNRPVTDYTVEIKHDLIEPALQEPVLMSADSIDPFDTGVLNRQAVPLRVERQWNLEQSGEPPRVFLTLEPVTTGVSAPIVPVRELGISWEQTNCAPSQDLTWTAVGATPSEWTAVTTAPTIAVGDTTGYALVSVGGTRSANQNWTITKPDAGQHGVGVKYTYSTAQVVTYLSMTHLNDNPDNSKRHFIIALRSDGVVEMLANVFDLFPSANPMTTVWEGSKSVTEVYFIAVSGRPGGSVEEMTANAINPTGTCP